jgi:hypothetical protein
LRAHRRRHSALRPLQRPVILGKHTRPPLRHASGQRRRGRRQYRVSRLLHSRRGSDNNAPHKLRVAPKRSERLVGGIARDGRRAEQLLTKLNLGQPRLNLTAAAATATAAAAGPLAAAAATGCARAIATVLLQVRCGGGARSLRSLQQHVPPLRQQLHLNPHCLKGGLRRDILRCDILRCDILRCDILEATRSVGGGAVDAAA